MKNAKIQAFSDLYFSVYGQNRILIFPYFDRFSDFLQKQENADTLLSIYGKKWIKEILYFGIFYVLFGEFS